MPVIIGTLPVTLTNGTLADANQVMQDLNYIVNQVNSNVNANFAPILNPVFQGTVTVPILRGVAGNINIGGVNFTGNANFAGAITAVTQPPGDSTTKLATTDFVQTAITGITGTSSRPNPIRNPTCELSDGSTPPNITNLYQSGPVIWLLARIDNTVSAGTVAQGTLAGMGTAQTQLKLAGATGDATSVVDFCVRVGAADACRFSNQTVSVSAVLRQESLLTAATSVEVYTPNARNDFSSLSAVTTAATGTLATSTTDTLKNENFNAGDLSNGLQINFKLTPGATFTSKDFYATDFNINLGAAALPLIAPLYPAEREAVYDPEIGTYTDTGAADAYVVSTGDEIPALYDGATVSFTVAHTNLTATPTLNVNGTGAKTLVAQTGGALYARALFASVVATVQYNKTTDTWELRNPYGPAATDALYTTTQNVTVPAGCFNLYYQAQGSGSQGAPGALTSGRGGSSGGYGYGSIAVTPGSTVALTVDGTASRVAYVPVGLSVAATHATSTTAPGSCTGATINYSGVVGRPGANDTGSPGGEGAPSFMGLAGAGGAASAGGANAVGGGSGGGGGGRITTGSTAGGNAGGALIRLRFTA